MSELIFGLVIYVGISVCLVIINFIKLMIYKSSKSKEKYPILYHNNILINIILYGTLLWLPYIIIRKLKDEL